MEGFNRGLKSHMDLNSLHGSEAAADFLFHFQIAQVPFGSSASTSFSTVALVEKTAPRSPKQVQKNSLVDVNDTFDTVLYDNYLAMMVDLGAYLVIAKLST